MAHYIKILGRLTTRAIKSHAFDKALSVATHYILREMRLADLKAKRVLLKRKREIHLHLLGKTAFRLIDSEIDPVSDSHTATIVQVLDEIGTEIQVVDTEIIRRREAEKAKHEQEQKRNEEQQQQQQTSHDDSRQDNKS